MKKGKITKRLNKVEKKVQYIGQPELKYIQRIEPPFQANVFTAVNPLIEIETGSGEEERIGNRISVKRIKLHFNVKFTGLNALTQAVRIIIFKDAGNSNTLTSANLLYPGSATPSVQSMTSLYNPDWVNHWKARGKNYTILRDVILKHPLYPMQPITGENGIYPYQVVFKKFDIKFSEHIAIWDGAGGADLVKNRIWFVIYPGTTGASENNPEISYTYQIFYTDV